jgi:hypothetical protein
LPSESCTHEHKVNNVTQHTPLMDNNVQETS